MCDVTLSGSPASATGVRLTIIPGTGDPLRIFDGDRASLVPDLVIIGPFTNDMSAVVTGTGDEDVYGDLLNYVITRTKTYADVLAVACYEQNGTPTTGTQSDYRDKIEAVAAAQGVASWNMYDAFAGNGYTGYSAANSAGLMYDTLHLSASGNRFAGAMLARLLEFL